MTPIFFSGGAAVMRQATSGMGSCLALAALLGAAASGCMPPLREKGIIGCSYRSVVDLAAEGTPGSRATIPVSLRVDPIGFSTPRRARRAEVPWLAALFPIVGLLLPPHQECVNALAVGAGGEFQDYPKSLVTLQDGEVQKLLYQEIKKSGLFTTVTCGGGVVADYVVRGRCDLKFIEHRHYSGLGILYCGLLPILTCPAATNDMRCAAHFEVVSRDGDRTLLSKDYESRIRYLMWVYNSGRVFRAYGRELFPRIVAQLIEDLEAIPRDGWGLP